MKIILKSLLIALLAIATFSLTACSIGVGGLQRYLDSGDGYQFLYPNGWVPVDVKTASAGVDVVFRDLIETTENLSVIISDVTKNKTLTELGTPSEVGVRFLKKINDDPKSDRQAELLSADQHENDGKIYYTLEYLVKLPNNQERHDLASVTVNRGKLVTFNLSTPEKNWDKVKSLFETSAQSFTVF
jgi:photosystem II oxygen-evolving enhancer protein 2